MDNIIIQYLKTPCGELVIGSLGDRLCLCDWRYRKMRKTIDSRIQKGLGAGFTEGDSAIIALAVDQLTEYFDHRRKTFSIPLLPVGTDFQKEVWSALQSVPYGSTTTYGRLAGRLGNPNAVRAGAAANGANAISIIIPCHRIVGSDGALVGYAGGLAAKRKLLKLEHRQLPLPGMRDQVS